jgi:chromosome segregation protein
LLKLKKLQILGFKSFCDRTELKFHGDGVAAIIGPNGCGKSNISDAIAWVLGEQSAKTLRGSRMEDVIFAGTRDRKPTGMAEVSLTLIDPGIYPGDAGLATEIELRDELPGDDWDEAEVRAQAAEEAERLTEEAQPGVSEEMAAQTSANEALSGSSREDEPAAQSGAPGAAENSLSQPSSAALSEARVVLKIRRRKFQQQFKAGEIAVTRRLFRSGDSEYLLNGKLCRLRDIQELFMGTGLGPETYALIEQGRIGQILSSRPTDRRAILEEAAGITKFKTKKRLAEARLEDAKQNLSRVNDIFEEITRQMNTLKRQAAKAERFAKLRDEMRAKLTIVLASKFAQLEKESVQLDQQIQILSEKMQRQLEAVDLAEQEHRTQTERGYAIAAEITENQERLNEIKLELDRAVAQRRHNEERCMELELRASSSRESLAHAEQRLTALEAERDANVALLHSAAAEVSRRQQDLELCRAQAEQAATRLSEMERRQEQSRIAVLEAVSAASHLRNHLTQAQERLAASDREAIRLEAEMETARSQVEAFGGQRGQVALEFESVSETVAGLVGQLSENRQLLEARRREEAEAKNDLDRLRAEHATALGKKSSLEAVIAEHGYSTESVRRLFQSGVMNGGLAPVGVLADFLEVDGRYESVVEDFLRDELNYIVVKSWDAADEGLRLLRTDVDGRATFLVHPEDAQAKFSFVVDEAGHHAPPGPSILPLKNTIRVLNGFGKSLEVVLPKLRDGYIVPDSARGRELALENPDAFFLSQSGECFHNLTVTGGRQRSEGPLSMKRELRELVRVLDQLELALRQKETEVLELGHQIKKLTALIDRLDGEKREADKQAMTSGHMLRQLDSEMARVEERSATCAKDLGRLREERREQEDLMRAREAELELVEAERSALEHSALEASEQLSVLRHQRDRATETVSREMAQLATLAERHRSAVSALERIESLVGEMRERVAGLTVQIDSSAREQAERREENEQMGERLVELEAERNTGAARTALLQLESEQVRARMGELEGDLREARHELDQARDRRGELSASAAKLASDAQYMEQTCLNELGIERSELVANSVIERLSGDGLAAEDRDYRAMRTRLEAMGPVNMMALEEYRETSERHAFLETQRRDLLDSIADTQATIKEIDVFSRQRFEEAFHRINENFQVTFRKLFGGGNAFMRLTDEENSAESGIDVVASPPGKKLQNVLLLSGGEKALTALALLVGIFQFQPSPFCILDEVDAPLDEANIGRFTELVQEMSVETQFVLITHSKKTMSIAPVLYGVTMQEPGVSKLVSVKLGATA